MKINHFKFLLIFIAFFSCKKDIDLVPFPVVRTVSSDVYSSGGVLLNGKIVNVGDAEVLDYGFKLFASASGSYYNVDHLATTSISVGDYAVEITQGLYPNTEYQYNAYVRTQDDTYVGETLSFFSTGSATPVLMSCDPELAHIGDTVILSGENFPTDINRMDLEFGDSFAQIITATSQNIEFKVPKPEGNQRELRLSAYDKSVVENGLLNLHTPVITNVTPTEAFFGETLTITGDHFNVNPNFTSCTIGGFDAQIVSTSRNEVQVIIPNDVNYSNSEIVLYAQNQEVSYTDFNLKVPLFTNVPSVIYTDTYFDVNVDITSANQNNFRFNDYETFPDIINDTTLRFYIPSSIAFDSRAVNLKWILNDLEVEHTLPLTISNPFYKIKDYTNNFFPFNDYTVFTINNEVVIIGNVITFGTSAKYIFKYDSLNREWVNEGGVELNGNLIPLEGNNKSFTYSNYDNSIYTLMNSSYSNNFLKINPNTGEVTQLSNNTSVAFYGRGFSHTNKVYFTNSYTTDLWAYHIDTDTWEVVTTLPYETSSFRNSSIAIYVDGDYAYFINGGYNNANPNDFWRLNLNDYTWEQLPNNPNPNEYSTIYKIGSELHVVSDFVWKYNTNTQSWTQLENAGITSGLNTPISSFFQDDIPYVIKEEAATNVTYLNLFYGDLVND